jgi:hypothetical protein
MVRADGSAPGRNLVVRGRPRGRRPGAHLTGRLDDAALLRTISVILVIAGISLAAQAVFS